jgi:hypothetical protein
VEELVDSSAPEVANLRTARTSEACRIAGVTCHGLRALRISDGLVAAEILLDKGANVRQCWHLPSGARVLAEAREWEARLADFRRAALRGHTYCDFYEGGWQDVLPARARRADGTILIGAEGGVGEAAILPWEVEAVVSTPAKASVTCRVALPSCGLEVVKRFTVRRGWGELRVETTLRNVAAHDLWISWTQHPALGGDLLDETARLQLPGGRLRATRNASQSDGDRFARTNNLSPTSWIQFDPMTGAAGRNGDDSFVTFGDIERGQAILANDRLGLAAKLRWDRATFPNAWLWCTSGEAIRAVAVEPSTTCLPEMALPPEPESLRLLRAGQTLRSWVSLAVVRAPGRRDTTALSLFGSGRS